MWMDYANMGTKHDTNTHKNMNWLCMFFHVFLQPCPKRLSVITILTYLFSLHSGNKTKQERREWESKMEAQCASTSDVVMPVCSQVDVPFPQRVLHSSLKTETLLDVAFKGKEILQKFKVIFQTGWFCSPSGKSRPRRGHFKQVSGGTSLSITFPNESFLTFKRFS